MNCRNFLFRPRRKMKAVWKIIQSFIKISIHTLSPISRCRNMFSLRLYSDGTILVKIKYDIGLLIVEVKSCVYWNWTIRLISFYTIFKSQNIKIIVDAFHKKRKTHRKHGINISCFLAPRSSKKCNSMCRWTWCTYFIDRPNWYR